MRCVVTGCAGFVGSTLAERLLREGHEVKGVDSFVDYYPREAKLRNLEPLRGFDRFSFEEEDLQTADLSTLLAGTEWIFHLAAQAGVRASWGNDFSIYVGNNIQASQRLLEAARSDGLRESLKKVVYASSSSVYGHAETLPTSESLKPQPISPYGVSKLAAEHLMVLYEKEFGVPTASLRYFTVYGPKQRPDMAFHRFAKAALLGEPISIFGDGEQSRDFTFVTDAVQATINAASATEPALVCNIGGGSRVTVNEVLSLVGDIVGRPLDVQYQSREKGDARHTGADTALARMHLNYSPTVELAEGLRREIQWMESLLCS
jgi:nucleoside-diphosphate-sugar epimerase